MDEKSSKGILKKSSVEQRQKSFQWDESNILATYHPADKTYGHMKIEEPKTPYVYESEDSVGRPSFNPEDLAARLAATVEDPEKQLPRTTVLGNEEEEHQRKFREKRKQHYNEFLAVKLAKENLHNDDDDDDEVEEKNEDKEIEDDEEIRRNVEQAAINARLNAELSRLSRTSADQSVEDNISRVENSSKNSRLRHARP